MTATPTARIIHGDCVEAMRRMPPDSVDAIVTDPPYGLEFMGATWDKFSPTITVKRSGYDQAGTSAELGARASSGGKHDAFPAYGKRRSTWKCAGCGKRDAFKNPHRACPSAEWRQEFVDALPTEALAFEQFNREWALEALRVLKPGGYAAVFGGTRTFHRMTCALEDVGFHIRDVLSWLYGQGFPKSVDLGKRDARFSGLGTSLKPAWEPIVLAQRPLSGSYLENLRRYGTGGLNLEATRITSMADTDVGRVEIGRHPANLLLDGSAAAQLGEESRFFYTAKADGDDRGLQNEHPTVKPLALMRWLCLLVTPSGGVLLDPFAGSGSTLVAARYAGFSSIGCERVEEYVATAARRFFPELAEVEVLAS